MAPENNDAPYENLPLKKAILFIIARASERHLWLTRTKLVKLLYLADRLAKERLGQTITQNSYSQYWHGPFAPAILNAIQDMNGYEIIEIVQPTLPGAESAYMCHYALGDSPRFEADLDDPHIEILDNVIDRFGNMSLSSLLEYVYSLPEVSEASPLDVVLM